jgi:CBS domain containing-hemolysin-like protein
MPLMRPPLPARRFRGPAADYPEHGNEPRKGSSIDVFLGLLAVFALILAHGFFVAGEFGLVAVDRSTIENEARQGSTRARSTLAALRSLSFQLSGAQLGITVTSLLVGFLTEPAVAPVFEPAMHAIGLDQSATALSITIALILATATEMVVAELIPKNLAIARPLGVALSSAPPLRLVNMVFKPLIVFLNASANWTVRLLGIEPQEELTSVRSLHELEFLIRSSKEAGALQDEEFALLARSISFATKTAAEALVPRTAIVALPAEATVGDLAREALDTGHSRFPVYRDHLDDILGIAYVKDIYGLPFSKRMERPITDITRPAVVVPESRDLESLLHDIRRARTQLAVVVDEYGGTAGIVTLEDLVEEIVGDIEDEYDPEAPAAESTNVPQGVHVLSGLLHADEVEEACGFEIPDGPYETLAGFLLSLFERIPAQGDHVSYARWEFKVVKMDGNRIDTVLVVRSPSEGRGQP